MKESARQTSHPSLELTAEPVGQLVELFAQRAEQLKFPDVDAEALLSAQGTVEAQRDAVELAAVALDEARQELVRVELALLEKARQGHAYATVFASNDDELRAELSQINLNANQRAPKKRRAMPAGSSKKSKVARNTQGGSSSEDSVQSDFAESDSLSRNSSSQEAEVELNVEASAAE